MGARNRPDVSVLIPCSRPDLIPGIVRSIALDARAVRCELVIAGRVSDHRESDWSVPVVLIECDPGMLNLMRRLMVARSAAQVIAFLDDDAIPEPGWLQAASALPPELMEIWTGPESPTRTTRGARLASEISSSRLAEGYQGHIGDGDHPVRWYDVPFCNLVTTRTLIDRVGLPDSRLDWDVDDFDFCSRAKSKGATFRTNSGLRIKHDRYPDTVPSWLIRKARERRRTGEKVVCYPGIYLRIPSVLGGLLIPWMALLVLIMDGVTRPKILLLAGSCYLTALVVEALRCGRRSGSVWRFCLGMASLHVASLAALQVGFWGALFCSLLDAPRRSVRRGRRRKSPALPIRIRSDKRLIRRR